MKRKFYITSIATAVLMLALSACGGNALKPKDPHDETKHKHHDEPYSMTVTLQTEGEPDIKLEITQDKDWESKELRVKAGVEYQMRLRYFAKDGDEITGEFATHGEDKIHQHFFTAKEKGVKILDRMKYRYADTDPWDKEVKEGAKLVGDKNPIGLKGMVTFLPTEEKSFTLWISMLHDLSGDKRLKDGTFGVWHERPQEKLQMGFDLNIYIPVVVE
ncbi:MAG: hypothetical protein Q4D93_04040 [Porphyromonas sp.]|nr:hypothetical protein [Porphyromonas sp.]